MKFQTWRRQNKKTAGSVGRPHASIILSIFDCPSQVLSGFGISFPISIFFSDP
jgi:hypothetical protein